LDYFLDVGIDGACNAQTKIIFVGCTCCTLRDPRIREKKNNMTTLYQNKTITIIGLGKTGLSCVEYLQSQQANIRVIDTRQHPAGADKLPKNIPLHTMVT